jgi:DNA-binding NarL/FixJ family response regulator
MISVVVADDQTLVRDGFRMILDAQEDIAVVAEADDGDAAVARVRELGPDLVLMDVRMPNLDGIAATRRIVADRLPTRVLVLTTFDSDQIVYDVLKAGASGFLLKNAPTAKLLDAVRTVAAGDSLLAPSITRRLVEEFVRRPPPGHALPPEVDRLTQRETEVLTLIANGLSNPEIARRLVISDATVKSHVNRIRTKLDLRDRVQAVVLAYETGLVRVGDASARVRNESRGGTA